jgi:hypothetical protein
MYSGNRPSAGYVFFRRGSISVTCTRFSSPEKHHVRSLSGTDPICGHTSPRL